MLANGTDYATRSSHDGTGFLVFIGRGLFGFPSTKKKKYDEGEVHPRGVIFF